MGSSIVIIGAGGQAVSVASVANSCGMSVVAYVDDNKAGDDIMGSPVIAQKQCLSFYQDCAFAIAIGDNSLRETVYQEYKTKLPKATFPKLIHESSVVGLSSYVGAGTVIMPLVNVGPNSRLAEFCILNTGSSVDHDCVMSRFSSLAPRATCGGGVSIGVRSSISIGATVKHNVCIGDDVVIGANSYVNAQVANNALAYGTPCKQIKYRKKGDPYL